MSEFSIRRGREADAAALAGLARQTFIETFAADNDPVDLALHVASAYGGTQQRQELADPSVATLLVEAGGELAGYSQLRSGVPPACVTGESPIELWRFYVASAWHGRGMAQSLMRAVETEAIDRGARTVWLGVWERNERAKAFYARAGFTDVGSHVFVVGRDAQVDRIMVRSLTGAFPPGVSPVREEQ